MDRTVDGDMSDYLRLADVPRRLNVPGRAPGQVVSLPTVWRWAMRGLRGVRLRTAKIGGHTCTTQAWVREFFEMLSADRDVPTAPPRRTPTQRQRAATRARRELRSAGIG